MDLEKELRTLGSSDLRVSIFLANPERAKGAIDAARIRGAKDVVAYALSLFNDAEWTPAGKGTPRHGTNQQVTTECTTCGGDRLVVVAVRKPEQSLWMRERGIAASEEGIEEYAACPDCNQADASFRRHDGSKFTPPDPAEVRERMHG